MHPETQHLAEQVHALCEENGLSAEFIITVMRWERRVDLHNYFGWTDDTGSLMTFETDTECLEYVIPRIKQLYLTDTGQYFTGYTVADVNKHYNGSQVWEDTITEAVLNMLNKERRATYDESNA